MLSYSSRFTAMVEGSVESIIVFVSFAYTRRSMALLFLAEISFYHISHQYRCQLLRLFLPWSAVLPLICILQTMIWWTLECTPVFRSVREGASPKTNRHGRDLRMFVPNSPSLRSSENCLPVVSGAPRSCSLLFLYIKYLLCVILFVPNLAFNSFL